MDKSKTINILFALSFLFLLLKIIAIYNSQLGLHGDEAQYWLWSKNLSWGYFSKPPLIALFIRIFTSISGDSVFGIKLLSVVIYIFTSFIVYLLSKKLFDKEIAIFSGLTFFLLPGVSFSSFIISTDVLLLFFWSLSLYLLICQIDKPRFLNAVALGVVIALGFLAKYAMVYFFICTATCILLNKDFSNKFKRNIKFYLLSFLVFLTIISPNIYWNIVNGWVTFFHTYDNISFGHYGLRFDEFFSFFLAQIFIVGPVFFLACLYFYKDIFKLSNKNSFLISYSLPVLIVVSLESFFVRAHGNWAAVFFVCFVILIVSVLHLRKNQIIFFSNVVNLFLGIIFFTLIITNYNLRAFQQLRGYDDFSMLLNEYSKNNNINNFVIQERMLYSLLAYHLNDYDYHFYTPKSGSGKIDHHFQLKNSLNENFNKDFIYIGYSESLNYLNKPHEKTLLKETGINEDVKNVKIYKYVFN